MSDKEKEKRTKKELPAHRFRYIKKDYEYNSYDDLTTDILIEISHDIKRIADALQKL